MYLVESKGGAILCMLLALFFLGTWPAILTLLERRGRLPQHTYLDYSITNLLAAVIIAFTFGEIGKSTTNEPNFLVQLAQIKMKLAKVRHPQTIETRRRIGAGVKLRCIRRREKKVVQEICCLEWKNLIAEASIQGYNLLGN